MIIERFYSNLSVKYKFIMLYFSIILALLLIFGVFSYCYSRNIIFKGASRECFYKMVQIGTVIDFFQDDMNNIFSLVRQNPGIQRAIAVSKHSKQMPDLDVASRDTVDSLLTSKGYIKFMIIYNAKGIPIYYRSAKEFYRVKPLTSRQEKAIYRQACFLSEQTVWLKTEESIFVVNNQRPKVFGCKVIKNSESGLDMGMIVVCVDEFEVFKLVSDDIKDESNISIFTNGQIVFSYGCGMDFNLGELIAFNKITHDKKGYFVKKVSGREMFIFYWTSNTGNGTILYSVSTAKLLKAINPIKIFLMVMVLACLLLAFPLTLRISSNLTSPIKRLLESMDRFQQGNFEERVEIKHKDEIGKLGMGYNRMVANVKDLINNVYVLQIKEREAELNALQFQINPHFLYNTLDSIYWKAENQSQAELSEMVYSLSRLFRLGLNRGKKFTVVANEKELIEHYLKLQKIRFKDKLKFTLFFEEAILDYLLPKLILQPFVENAILHGIEPRKSGGSITITGEKREQNLRFVIEDNGVGMDETTLCKLLSNETDEPIHSTAKHSGYAIRNTVERLNIYFGNNYSLQIFSKVDQGTRVEITVPAQQQSSQPED